MKNLPNTGVILTITQTINAAISSVADAEIGASFVNAQEAIPAYQTLEQIEHGQPPMTIQIYN